MKYISGYGEVILTLNITWMNLEDIMPDKKSQSQKRQILYGYTYMKYLEQSNSYRQKVELQLPKAVGEGRKEEGRLEKYLMRMEFQLWKIKKRVLQMGGGDNCTVM